MHRCNLTTSTGSASSVSSSGLCSTVTSMSANRLSATRRLMSLDRDLASTRIGCTSGGSLLPDVYEMTSSSSLLSTVFISSRSSTVDELSTMKRRQKFLRFGRSCCTARFTAGPTDASLISRCARCSPSAAKRAGDLFDMNEMTVKSDSSVNSDGSNDSVYKNLRMHRTSSRFSGKLTSLAASSARPSSSVGDRQYSTHLCARTSPPSLVLMVRSAVVVLVSIASSVARKPLSSKVNSKRSFVSSSLAPVEPPKSHNTSPAVSVTAAWAYRARGRWKAALDALAALVSTMDHMRDVRSNSRRSDDGTPRTSSPPKMKSDPRWWIVVWLRRAKRVSISSCVHELASTE
mmetsp:Transcript_5256/g.16891  ORF Transcript_5256/g.16891 Transcript_5256/m.16891 type:complete len:347 (-) Transcript_5256:1391-2431(-)